MTTPQSQVLDKQVAEWRKEAARLQDLIAHAIGGEQSQVVSIDTHEFRELLQWLLDTKDVMWAYEEHRKRFIAHIDAKIAQAREEGRMNSTGYAIAKAGAEELARMQERAEKAEAALAAIRDGVEKLTQYCSWDGKLCETQAGNHPERAFVRLDTVLALLQPQHQESDTSGLPG